jgi:hypothetical protein
MHLFSNRRPVQDTSRKWKPWKGFRRIDPQDYVIQNVRLKPALSIKELGSYTERVSDCAKTLNLKP